MGNTTSCCVSSSPKHRRNTHSRLEPYRPEPELSREETGCNLQHISDRENLDGKMRQGELLFTDASWTLRNGRGADEMFFRVLPITARRWFCPTRCLKGCRCRRLLVTSVGTTHPPADYSAVCFLPLTACLTACLPACMSACWTSDTCFIHRCKYTILKITLGLNVLFLCKHVRALCQVERQGSIVFSVKV